jgi:hypothetical protein
MLGLIVCLEFLSWIHGQDEGSARVVVVCLTVLAKFRWSLGCLNFMAPSRVDRLLLSNAIAECINLARELHGARFLKLLKFEFKASNVDTSTNLNPCRCEW